jgi:DNA-binding XRE family transcriptional regulator
VVAAQHAASGAARADQHVSRDPRVLDRHPLEPSAVSARVARVVEAATAPRHHECEVPPLGREPSWLPAHLAQDSDPGGWRPPFACSPEGDDAVALKLLELALPFVAAGGGFADPHDQADRILRAVDEPVRSLADQGHLERLERPAKHPVAPKLLELCWAGEADLPAGSCEQGVPDELYLHDRAGRGRGAWDCGVMPSTPRILAPQADIPGPLARARLVRGLRQADLARLAGVSRQYVSKVERERWVPPVRRQDQLAAALGIAREDLWPQGGAP